MNSWHDRFPKQSLRWAAGLGLAGALALPALSATAQIEVQSSPIAQTPANCVIHLSVANPNPGDQEIPRRLVMSGTALDGTATSGTGISRVQAFLGNRDLGGTAVGTAAFVAAPSGLAGAWRLTATIPPNVNGGQNMFVYGLSSVSGQEAMVSIPIVVGESLTVHHITVPNMAQTFCPRVMTPTAQPAPPGNPPVAAPPTAAIQLSISSPPAPGDPLSFNTSTLTAAPGAQVTLTYTNDSNQPHNWHLYNGPGPSSPSIVETRTMTGPGAVDTAHFTAPTQAGSYFFRCDVHPTVMTGNLVVGGTP